MKLIELPGGTLVPLMMHTHWCSVPGVDVDPVMTVNVVLVVAVVGGAVVVVVIVVLEVVVL